MNAKNLIANEKSEKFFLGQGVRVRYNRSASFVDWRFTINKNFEKVRECVSPLLSFRQKIGCG